MPKLPPPPRSPQNRSGSLSASTRRNLPSGVTSSIATTLFADSDPDAAQAIGADEDDVVHRSERLGVVARPLGRDLHAVRSGEVHDRDDVVLVGRDRDERRLLHESEVERLRGGGPLGVAGLDDRAGDAGAQCA
jgi:hypothetical protein